MEGAHVAVPRHVTPSDPSPRRSARHLSNSRARLSTALTSTDGRVREVLKAGPVHRLPGRTQPGLDHFQQHALPLPAPVDATQDVLVLDRLPEVLQSRDGMYLGGRHLREIDERLSGDSDKMMGQRVERILRMEQRLGEGVSCIKDVRGLGVDAVAVVAGHKNSVVLEGCIEERHGVNGSIHINFSIQNCVVDQGLKGFSEHNIGCRGRRGRCTSHVREDACMLCDLVRLSRSKVVL